MPFKLNLHHEIVALRLAQKRDPMKLTMLVVAGVVACFAGYYVLAMSRAQGITSALKAKQAELSKLEPLAAEAKAKQEKLNVTISAADKIVKRIENRTSWAPFLEQIAGLVTPNVQINRLSIISQRDPTARLVVTMDGLAAGDNPRAAAENFRQSLVDNLGKSYKDVLASFRSLEESVEKSNLNGKLLPTAAFTIAMQGDILEAPATPALSAKN